VIEELGKGGMGRVYKAFDTETKEHVALKILNRDIVSDESVIERFRNELKFARRISHRNICRMYDLGRAQDTTYISMEFVSGEDLKRLLRRVGQLSARRALAVAEQVLDGLAEAHRLGVVHRDLKPQNIMIDRDGNARIMDFGIARSIQGTGITDTGAVLGTPDYMAPEQLEGKEADKRTDIYAFGAILYEMATGVPPFKGDTPFGVAMKHRLEAPRDPREINPQIPDGLALLILQCLEKEKEKRFQSAEDIQARIKAIVEEMPGTGTLLRQKKARRARPRLKALWIGMVTAFVAAGIILAFYFAGRLKERPQPVAGKPTAAYKSSIAVLPFEDLSPQRDQEQFCNGITEALITKLAGVGQLKVISRTSVMRYKGTEKDIREIGRELDVATILEGSIQKEKDNIRINAQLVNVADGAHLWAESFDRKLAGIFAVQDEISKAIVNALRIELVAGQEYMLVKRYTQDPDAYNFYLEGRFNWNKRTELGLRRAIELYQEAIARDSNFALAYAGIADAYSLLGRLSLAPPREVYPKAKDAAEKALQLDDALAEGYIALAFVKYNYDWDWMDAEIDFNWSVGLNPNYATAYQYYGSLLVSLGRFEEALAKFEKARELDPNSMPIQASIASLFYYARQFDQAIKKWREILKIHPEIDWAHFYLGLSYLEKRAGKKAVEEFEKAEKISGGSVLSLLGKAYAYALAGKRDEALKGLESLVKRSNETYVPPYFLAMVELALGEKDKAFDYLEKSYADRDSELIQLKVDPQLDLLRDDPRFEALLGKMNLR
jgi:TolB-like protein/Tfp pilus assembly protein PilF